MESVRLLRKYAAQFYVNISISIVEDDQRVCASLSKLIDSSPGYRCLSRHGSAEDALREIPKVQPNVVLMDINLPKINGVECVRQLKPQLRDTQIIMLTAYQNPEYIFNALAAGATGYLLKQTPSAELLDAIKLVHTGGSPMSGHIARKIVQLFQHQQPLAEPADEINTLTPREIQILNLLSKGFLYKEIAAETDLAYATVHSHIRNIYKKLQVNSRTEAITKHLGFGQSFRKFAKACLR